MLTNAEIVEAMERSIIGLRERAEQLETPSELCAGSCAALGRDISAESWLANPVGFAESIISEFLTSKEQKQLLSSALYLVETYGRVQSANSSAETLEHFASKVAGLCDSNS